MLDDGVEVPSQFNWKKMEGFDDIYTVGWRRGRMEEKKEKKRSLFSPVCEEANRRFDLYIDMGFNPIRQFL